jgi:hypothetical protein
VTDSNRLRILHLSDLHAKAEEDEDYFGKKRVVESLLRDLREQTAEKSVDLIVFSGDLAFDGTQAALAAGRSMLLEPIRNMFADAPFVLVPGNHDVDREQIEDVEELGLQAALDSREAVQKRLADSAHAAAARKRLSAWDQFVSDWETKAESVRLHPYGSSFVLNCNGLAISVGAFDTAWRSQGGAADRGRLLLGADSVSPFLDSAADADICVAVFHHPISWLAGFDGEAVDRMLQGSKALVLTGHEHAADPKLEQTAKGAALYCACPSTYADVGHPNGYAIIDVDVRGGQTSIDLRKWQPDGDRFGIDVETAGDTGRVQFQWPIPLKDAPVPIDVSRQTALEPLARVVQEQSVLIDHLSDLELRVSDLVVAPRFWPIPHTEVFDRSVPRKARPNEADPFTTLERERVVIVSGPRMSGATTSILWLLEQHFERVGTHFPAYTQSDPRFSLGRINGAIEEARSRSGDESTPVIVAVDDVAPEDALALGRLIRAVDENPDVKFILGCHGQQHETVARALEGTRVKISSETLYLGPFGRRETRALVMRMVGSEGDDLVQRVLDLIQRQRLPRNPLNLAALISVLLREPNMAAVNETGLLQSYCNVLLDNPIGGVDPDKLAMDQTRREHLLKRIARTVVEEDVSRLKRLEIEKLVSDYFEAIAFDTGSPGRQIDSLIARRVLAEDGSGVGFRYPALLHLFAAKAAQEQPGFKAFLLQDKQRYAPVIRHLAGLTRSNAELLQEVLDGALQVRAEMAEGIEVQQFELIKDDDGLSQIRNFDHARALVDRRPELPSEEQLDEIYDEVIEEPPEEPAVKPFEASAGRDATWELSEAFGLAAGVLQSSELVEDIDLRTKALREIIEAWGVMTVLMALEEDMFRQLHELLDPLLPQEANPEKRRKIIEYVVRVFIVNLMSLTLNIEAGSIHHVKILTGLLDDPEFMQESSNALFATMMYASLEFSGWPGRLHALVGQHGEHPMVTETVRQWALMEYHHGDISAKDQSELLDLLTEMMTPTASGGKDAVATRAGQMAEIREGLKAARTQSRFSGMDSVVNEAEAEN